MSHPQQQDAEEERYETSEVTPLLVHGNAAAPPELTTDSVAAAAVTSNGQIAGHDDAEGQEQDEEDKPLPKLQIMLLCYARIVEPIAFYGIMPYVNQMVQRNGQLAETEVGFYSGLIESLFSLTQAIVMLFWGRASDKFGRKPVLVLSVAGTSISTALFGMSTTIWQMVLTRCIGGVFAGSIITIRTMIAEHSTAKTQARSFSWFALGGNTGIFLGPLLGGVLADPASQYGGIFKSNAFFLKYPYALSGFVAGIVGMSAALTTFIFVEETLDKRRSTNDCGANMTTSTAANRSDDNDGKKPAQVSLRKLMKAPGVAIVLYVYCHVMVLAYSYAAVIPVFWFTSVKLGGYGFTPLLISLFFGLTGVAQGIWLLVVFPPLQHRVGTNGVMRLCAIAYPFFYAILPLGNVLLKTHTRAGTTTFFTMLPIATILGTGVSMCFTSIQLGLNDVCPSPQMLSMLNALALTLISALRAFVPVVYTSAFAVGARTQWLGGYFIWVLMLATALGYTVASRYLPDYEKIKEDRRAAAR